MNGGQSSVSSETVQIGVQCLRFNCFFFSLIFPPLPIVSSFGMLTSILQSFHSNVLVSDFLFFTFLFLFRFHLCCHIPVQLLPPSSLILFTVLFPVFLSLCCFLFLIFLSFSLTYSILLLSLPPPLIPLPLLHLLFFYCFSKLHTLFLFSVNPFSNLPSLLLPSVIYSLLFSALFCNLNIQEYGRVLLT